MTIGRHIVVWLYEVDEEASRAQEAIHEGGSDHTAKVIVNDSTEGNSAVCLTIKVEVYGVASNAEID